MKPEKTVGSLYIVATPIGNPEDITLRAIHILKHADAIICEEFKEGSKLLHSLDIQNNLVTLNEHNEAEVTDQIISDLALGKTFALVSDCGTPNFADPGKKLINELIGTGIKVIPIPGTSSLMTALSVCAFRMDQFRFVGFLPPKQELRKSILQSLKRESVPLILMDTPYRLGRLLVELSEIFGKEQTIFLGCDLTMPSELILHGSLDMISKRIGSQKKEFILIVDSPSKNKRKFD